jgi:hypothetical protein
MTSTDTRFSNTLQRKRAADRRVYGRTRITNGSQFLPGIDNRSLWARRCKDIYDGCLAAMPNATVDQRSHLKRASIIEAKLEYLEAGLFDEDAKASDVDLDLYQRMTGNHRRALAAAGLHQQKQSRAREREPGPLGRLLSGAS